MTVKELLGLLELAGDALNHIDQDNLPAELDHQVAFIVRDAVSAVRRAREMVERLAE